MEQIVERRKNTKVGITKVIKITGISPERLRYWESKGIITPEFVMHEAKRARRYTRENIDVILKIKGMIENEGYTLKGAAGRLNRPYK